MKDFLEYMKSRRMPAVVCIIVMLAFASSYLLFEMPAITVVYPLGLSIAVLVIGAAAGYLSNRKRRKLISDDELPAPLNQIEEEYQNMISRLKEDARRTGVHSAAAYRDMIDYYTLWAHQIKTPIASMRLQLQSEDSDSARRLGGELNRIEGYVEMVLAYLRLDSGSTDYVIREHELDEIIRTAVRKFSREFILKKLSLDYSGVDMTVLTDEKWLAFVIEQLISNAVKYTGEGGTIRIYGKSGNRLCIEDTGIGISAEDLPRIFEKGYTGFNGRMDKKASGIGLYLCRRILDNLGHGIAAESTPGKGTTMVLNLEKAGLQVE